MVFATKGQSETTFLLRLTRVRLRVLEPTNLPLTHWGNGKKIKIPLLKFIIYDYVTNDKVFLNKLFSNNIIFDLNLNKKNIDSNDCLFYLNMQINICFVQYNP